MTQLEIQFFWPLTEQINLDLDYTPCIRNQEEKRILEQKTALYSPHMYGAISLTTTGSNITSNFEIKPGSKTAGYYKVNGTNLHVHLEKKPNIVTRWAMKYVFNMEWHESK